MYRRVPSDEATVSGPDGGQGSKGSQKNQRTMRDRFTEYMLRSEAPPPRSDCCTPITEGPNGPTINGFTLPRKKEAYCIDLLFIRRMWHFAKILLKMPSRVGWLYLIMTIFCCLNEVIVYYVGTIPSRYYKVLGDRDRASFWRLLFTSLGTVFLAGFGKCGVFFLGSLISLESRRTLTLHFHKLYLRTKLFYRILFMHDEELDNPDQRITQDIEKMSETLRKMVEDLIITPLLVLFYTYQCWKMAGYTGVLGIYLYFLISVILSRILINPIVDAVFYKESAEGYFRYLHVRFRQFAESITFSRGEGEAKHSADEMLEVLLRVQLDVIYKEMPLKFLQQGVSYFGSILSYVIIAIPIFMGSYDHLPSPDVAAVISQNAFVSMYLTFQFSKIIDCTTDFSDLAGYASRLGQLLEALEDMNIEIENIAIDFPHEEPQSTDNSIRLENISFHTPTGDLVISDFTFRFEPGVNTIIVGPNGAGKTSLLRAMGGLWPVSKGEIILPRQSFKDVIFLPQIPYMAYGTLREQLVYPYMHMASSVSDSELMKALKLARLDHITTLIDDFDFSYSTEWNKMLSPGEQQKLAFALLDEATCSMDNASETEMFKQCALFNITLITVSHHPHLDHFHRQKITIGGRGTWSWSEITGEDTFDDEDTLSRGDSMAGPAPGVGLLMNMPEDAPFNTQSTRR
ncbi:ATP-binding cassette sub- D member 4 [Mortierella sp. NVP85]|nr:ATP-binding cassette sub- D member 4 [Mortierella sp. NVP85]